MTDYQANETELPAQSGVVDLPLKPLACFIEGADLDGRWMPMVSEDFTRYTSLRTRVLELMVFGP